MLVTVELTQNKCTVQWLWMYLMNHIYCTSHGCKTKVRAAEWRDTERVRGRYPDHNDKHTHTHTVSHPVTLPLLHIHLQKGLPVAHTGILHLSQSTRGVVGSDVSDGYQGSD